MYTTTEYQPTQQPQAELRPTVTLEQICDAYGVCPRTVENWLKERGFPKPLMFSARMRRWYVDQINEWVDRKATV